MRCNMKKIVLILSLFLTACSTVNNYDTEFKNPIFYQPLRPLSKTVGYTYLTPTSVDFRTPLDKNKLDLQGKCDLIENKQDRITLKCNLKGWGKTYDWYLTYIVKEIFFTGCLIVAQYNYDKPEDYPESASYSSYCVTPPEDMTSESD